METLLSADEKVFFWINGRVGAFPPFDRAMEWVVSDYLVPVGFVLTLLALWFASDDRARRLRYQVGIFAALGAMGFSSLAVFIINGAYFRPRPFVDNEVSLLFYQPTDSSFPANAMAATFGIAFGIWGVNRRVGSALIAVATLFAFSRVYAGVHYPLDTIAAAMIALVIAFLVYKLRDLLGPIPGWVVRMVRVLVLA